MFLSQAYARWSILGSTVIVIVLGCILIAPGAFGCDPDQELSHVLVGQAYQASGNCLAASSSIDVVDGPTPLGICGPTCIEDTLGNVYVTQMCAPYPPLDTTETADAGPDPTCTLALAASEAGIVCGADAGADAGSDTGMDAGMDAGMDSPPMDTSMAPVTDTGHDSQEAATQD